STRVCYDESGLDGNKHHQLSSYSPSGQLNRYVNLAGGPESALSGSSVRDWLPSGFAPTPDLRLARNKGRHGVDSGLSPGRLRMARLRHSGPCEIAAIFHSVWSSDTA